MPQYLDVINQIVEVIQSDEKLANLIRFKSHSNLLGIEDVEYTEIEQENPEPLSGLGTGTNAEASHETGSGVLPAGSTSNPETMEN